MVALAEAFVKIRPEVDTAAFKRDVNVLRGEIDKIRGKDIVIGVDVTKAYIDVITLKEEIQQINRLRPSVRADADTSAAMAQIAALAAEARKLDGLTPTVRPDVDDSGVRAVGDAAQSSSSSISGLAAAGVALAPAIVPSAAAVTQAIAGITQMAIGAAGGIGVIALAAVGVVGALKAMSAADDQATQSAVSLAGNQARVASASDAVRSAQSGLANAVASSADSQRRASQAIITASAQETDAHRALRQAQIAVTQARIDAARAAQDLQSRAANNAIDQRQATLDVTKAEEALAAARANAGPGADNSRTVQEAQIALDRQRQRVTDLATEQKRLAEDKTKSDKAGVDGSTQVVAALDRVRQATDQVHKAEQSTAEARAAYATQARQSAFSVAQAQQSVISAQRSLQQATEQTATAGGAAMLALQQSMADLSPAGQRFATFLYGLKPAVLDLRRAAEAGLLPGAQAGLESLLPLMPDAITYTSRYATAVGNLARRAGEAFSQPYWRGFARDLVGSSIPAMETAAGVAYNMALGVSSLVRASLPLSQNFGSGLLSFSQDFARWALTVQNTQGFRDLMDYIRTQGPIVADTIIEVAKAAFRVVEAAAPIGGITLTVIRLLAEAINALPIPVLTGLAVGIGAVVLASKGLALVKELWFSTFGIQFVQMLTNAQIAMALAATQGAGPLGRGLAGAQAAAGTLAATIGPAGALGIALAGAAILAVIYAQKSAEQTARVNNLTRALGALGDAYKKTHDLGSQSVRDVVLQSNELSKLTLKSDQYGVTVEQIARASGGERDAQRDVTAALDTKAAALQAIIDHERASGAGESGRRNQTQRELDQLNEERKALKDRFGEVARNAEVTRLLADAQGRVTTTVYQQTPVQKALGDALKVLADQTSTAADKAGALRQADEAVFSGMRAAITTADASAAAQDRLVQTLSKYTDEHGRNTAAFDVNTAAGRDNRSALEQRLTTLNQEFFADVQAGVAIDEATKKHDINRDAVSAAAKATGVDKDEVNKLVTAFGTLPTDPKVVVSVSGVADAMTQLETAQIAQFGLIRGLSPAEATKQWREQKQDLRREANRATGGPISGPGTGTSDSIRAVGPGGARYRLSAGEHIITAAEVKAAGGHGAIQQWRQLLLGGMSPQAKYPGDGSAGLAFAKGGPVRPKAQPASSATWPFNINAANTLIPKPLGYLGAAAGGVAGTLQWLQAQAGKPYIWASAGPDGFDCSGLVSAVWNLLHGLTPYAHTFSTMNQAGFFPKPGFGPILTAGWTNPGEPGPGGSNVGHTAGILAGLPFESVGGAGVKVGPGVTPVGSFAHIGHFAKGGPVHPLNQLSMDTGYGVLKPGRNIVDNGTGQNEPIAAGPIRLDEYSIQRLTQALTSRPSRVEVVGPNDWGLAVAGMTP